LGRSAAFDAIVKGERIKDSNAPASFSVLLNNLKGLSLNVELLRLPEEGRNADKGLSADAQ